MSDLKRATPHLYLIRVSVRVQEIRADWFQFTVKLLYLFYLKSYCQSVFTCQPFTLSIGLYWSCAFIIILSHKHCEPYGIWQCLIDTLHLPGLSQREHDLKKKPLFTLFWSWIINIVVQYWHFFLCFSWSCSHIFHMMFILFGKPWSCYIYHH